MNFENIKKFFEKKEQIEIPVSDLVPSEFLDFWNEHYPGIRFNESHYKTWHYAFDAGRKFSNENP